MRWTIATKYQVINISHQKLDFVCASILALQKYLKRKQEINISLWTYKKCIQSLLYFCNALISLLWISTFHVDLVVTYISSWEKWPELMTLLVWPITFFPSTGHLALSSLPLLPLWPSIFIKHLQFLYCSFFFFFRRESGSAIICTNLFYFKEILKFDLLRNI